MDLDTGRPTAARAYDYLLGGTHHYAADREMIRQAMTFMPDLPLQARANRDFPHRAVAFLAEAGIRQFLDIGSGIPTAGNVHEIAQRSAPGSYLVIAHGTGDGRPADADRLVEISRRTPTTMTLRDRAGVLRFFDGFTLVDPGLVWAPLWRPTSTPADPERASNYVGVGRLS